MIDHAARKTASTADAQANTADAKATAALMRALTTFGALTAGQDTPSTGYTFDGYAGPDAATGQVGAIAGIQSVSIGGIYTATANTNPALPDIAEGSTYYARLGTAIAPEGPVPLYVIVNDVAYPVGPALNGRFYEVMGFGGFANLGVYRVQVIFTDGTAWITQQHDSVNTLPAIDAEGVVVLKGRLSGGQPIHFWQAINEVPDTPGTQSGIGHVLMVTGEGDKDYAFRAIDFAAAIAAYLRDNPPSAATDQTARDAAAAASLAAKAADDKAVAAGQAAMTADGKADAAAQTAEAANMRANDNTREVRTARAEAQGALAVTDRLAVFGQYELNPGGISGATPPDFIALTLSTKRTPKIIKQIQVNLGGVIVANIVRNTNPVPPATDLAEPFNTPADPYELAGGIINCSFVSDRDKRTFENAVRGTVQNRPQFVHGSITYTFDDDTTATDRIHFGVNNNGFDLARNPEFASDVTTIANARAAATPGPVLVVENIASFDVTANRFEDGDGDEVVVPDFAEVYLTKAIYDAAVAAAAYTPNPKATFNTSG